MPSPPTVHYHSLGTIDYKAAWELQEKLLREAVEQKKANRSHPDEQQPVQSHLLFCEHPHVFTLGKSGKMEHLLLSETQLKAEGIQFYRINRGGDITYHGPGQLVGYPILDLENFQTDIHWYLRGVEEAAIQVLAEYGLKGTRIKGLTGVWLNDAPKGPRKIMAIGVRCSRWVTMHGFALNIHTDLSYFGKIIPCGITDKAVTSLEKELRRKVSFDEVKHKMLLALKTSLGFRIKETESTS